MAQRRLRFTVDDEPLVVEIGGEEFTAPPVLAPAVLAALLDKQGDVQKAFDKVEAQAAAGESGAIRIVLGVLSRPPDCPACGEPLSEDRGATHPDGSNVCFATGLASTPDPGIFDLIFTDEQVAARFRARLYGRGRPFDLHREVMPAIMGIVEEYTGRPMQPPSLSSTPSANGGGSSTDGASHAVSIPAGLTPAGSST